MKESSLNNKTGKLAKGLIDDITPYQYNQYLEFKKMLFEKKIITDFSNYNTLFLLRFLRARKFNLDDALKMFLEYLDWKNKLDFKDILSRKYPFETVAKYYPKFFHKTDKLGRPIYFEIISKINITEVFKAVSEEELINMTLKEYDIYLNYRLPMCSKVIGLPIEQSLTIIDVNDVSLNFVLKVKDFLKKTTFISQNYYPEMLGHLFIINAGFIFKTIWAVIKGFIDEKTKQKISIEGHDYYKKLIKFVDEENIPSFLGGKCKCEHSEGGCMTSDVGPWNP